MIFIIYHHHLIINIIVNPDTKNIIYIQKNLFKQNEIKLFNKTNIIVYLFIISTKNSIKLINKAN